MALKLITENPKITDQILFEIETPDVDGCFSSDPYKVDSVTIYFIERSFTNPNFGEYDQVIVKEELQAALDQAKKAICADPSVENQLAYQSLVDELESNQTVTKFYFKDARPIEVIGTASYPAWLSTDIDNSPLVKVPLDENDNPQFGHFTYTWDSMGAAREGDYFVCWTWTPLPAGEKLSAHIQFRLEGDTAAVNIPIHQTDPLKYETLLERYLPEMYKSSLCQDDLTPLTTQRLNKAIGDGFTLMENLANQIIDLLDANVLHESMLMYLSNMFDLKLKSNDPTLWRRQIKQAVPLFKKKGTLPGLEEALTQAGMTLLKNILYWQVVSPYTWQESFKVTDSACFKLYQPTIIEPIDVDNFEVAIRHADEDEYEILSSDYVTFSTNTGACEVQMCWVGDELSANPIQLVEGDIIRVLYQYKEIPDGAAQAIENFIRALPLADTRDEGDQDYPPKNWNVRLIEEDDPMFDVVVPVKHPFHPPLIFGKIRTEFPYSENIYNREEYNGSTRDSYDACFIDKGFIDPCGSCASSKFSAIVEIEELSNDRIQEAIDVLNEYKPFHAVLHSISFSGMTEDLIVSPVETIEKLVTIDMIQNVISGNVNPFFNRVMEDGLTTGAILRDQLADQVTVLSGKLGTAYNSQISLITPLTAELDDVGIAVGSNLLEVLSPSLNSGTYMLTDEIYKNKAKLVGSPPEPLDTSAFTFNLSNVRYSNSTTNITQANLFTLSDENVDFAALGVKGLFDVNEVPDYTEGAWEVEIPLYGGSYVVDDVINGNLILVDDGSLPSGDVSGLTYTLKDYLGSSIANSTTGDLDVASRALVDLNDTAILNLTDFVNIGNYFVYSGTEYRIIALDGDEFFIDGWTGGDVGGASVSIRKRLMSNQIGLFGYSGLKLISFADHEVEFGMINGNNPPLENQRTDNSKFKENFLFKIDNQLFKIAEIDGINVTLEGQPQSWKTLSAGGTIKAYEIVHFENQIVSIGFTVFDQLDRRGKDVVIREIYDQVDQNTAIIALSSNREGGGFIDAVNQDESISFQIEYMNGESEEGEV